MKKIKEQYNDKIQPQKSRAQLFAKPLQPICNSVLYACNIHLKKEREGHVYHCVPSPSLLTLGKCLGREDKTVEIWKWPGLIYDISCSTVCILLGHILCFIMHISSGRSSCTPLLQDHTAECGFIFLLESAGMSLSGWQCMLFNNTPAGFALIRMGLFLFSPKANFPLCLSPSQMSWCTEVNI